MFRHLEIQQEKDDYDDSYDQEIAVSQKLSGDVLLEIFIRLPDFRTARRFATVCRFWRSLICHDPKFVSRFLSQHRLHLDRYPPSFPHTIMFRKTDETSTDQPVIRQIFSEEWLHFDGKSTPSYSEFLPNSPTPIVRASCNDLLLVSSGPNCTTDDLYVCNPDTKKFVKLPTIIRPRRPSLRERAAVGYALLCMPVTTNNNNIRFKVVEIVPKKLDPQDLLHGKFIVMVFCSESRKWERKSWRYRYTCPRIVPTRILPLDIIVARGEVVYWMENGCSSYRIYYLHLSEERISGTIRIPPHASDHHQHRIGVVHVELRLIRVTTARRQSRVDLKVWRLRGESEWDLVHQTRFKRPEGVSEGEKLLVPFVHPTNGDLVYIVWGTKVFLFNLVKASYSLIDELPETVDELISIPTFLPYVGSII